MGRRTQRPNYPMVDVYREHDDAPYRQISAAKALAMVRRHEATWVWAHGEGDAKHAGKREPVGIMELPPCPHWWTEISAGYRMAGKSFNRASGAKQSTA